MCSHRDAGRNGESWMVLAGQPQQHHLLGTGSKGRSHEGPDLVLGTSPWPCWQLTRARPPPSSCAHIQVICMTNSSIFHRKPSHQGCQGEFLHGLEHMQPLCCHGAASPQITTAGVQTSPATVWHHLPSHPQRAETAPYPMLPAELHVWCQILLLPARCR